MIQDLSLGRFVFEAMARAGHAEPQPGHSHNLGTSLKLSNEQLPREGPVQRAPQ